MSEGTPSVPHPDATATAKASSSVLRPANDPDARHATALEGIRRFLRETTCYSILPESYRLIVLDNELTIKRALAALTLNGVASAPLYDSSTFTFAGMLTLTDFINIMQYYYTTAITYDGAAADVDGVKLRNLREIEQAIGVPPPPTVSVHPDDSLYDACAALVRTHARRTPLIDLDDQTGKETILSVLTQYRVLKFIAINCLHDCARLSRTIASLGIGTYISSHSPNAHSPHPHRRSRSRSAAPLPLHRTTSDDASSQESSPILESDRFHPIATATMSTTVFDVVHLFSELGISAVPIIDPQSGRVINLYETVDVVDLVRQNDRAYQILDLTIEQALARRSRDFPGVVCCTPNDTLSSILHYVREKRVHRMVIVGEDGTLVGILSLSDVLRNLVGKEDLNPLKDLNVVGGYQLAMQSGNWMSADWATGMLAQGMKQ